MTKLAPGRLVGQMMGAWFMGAAIGNLVAGLVTRFMPQTETVEAAMQNGVQTLRHGRRGRRSSGADLYRLLAADPKNAGRRQLVVRNVEK